MQICMQGQKVDEDLILQKINISGGVFFANNQLPFEVSGRKKSIV